MTHIPLRLRRRRDGSLALTDGIGRVLTPDLTPADPVLPEEHLFIYTWLNGEGARVARVENTEQHRVIKLSLANATALYQVIEDQEEQVAIMAGQADYRGASAKLAPEDRDRAAGALAAQGILARLVEFKITKPAKINEALADQLADQRAARDAADALAKARARLASSEEGK